MQGDHLKSHAKLFSKFININKASTTQSCVNVSKAKVDESNSSLNLMDSFAQPQTLGHFKERVSPTHVVSGTQENAKSRQAPNLLNFFEDSVSDAAELLSKEVRSVAACHEKK